MAASQQAILSLDFCLSLRPLLFDFTSLSLFNIHLSTTTTLTILIRELVLILSYQPRPFFPIH